MSDQTYINLLVKNLSITNTNSQGNIVNSYIQPPIVLNPNKSYFIGAQSADIVNCNPNVINGKNSVFKFTEKVNGIMTNFVYQFDTGLYSLVDFQNEINKNTLVACNNSNLFYLEADLSSSKVALYINSNTASVDFSDDGVNVNIFRLLGFKSNNLMLNGTRITNIYGPLVNTDIYIESETRASLNSLLNYIVHCNLCTGTYTNNTNTMSTSDVLCVITPNVSSGSTIQYRPTRMSWTSLNTSVVSLINVSITDQNNENVDMTYGTNTNPEIFNVNIIISDRIY